MGNIPATESVATAMDFLKQKTFTRTNPTTIEELHKQCTDLQPKPFTGFRLEMIKTIDERLHLSHILHLEANAPCDYSLGTACIGLRRYNELTPQTVVWAEIGNRGCLETTVMHMLSERQRVKFFARIVNSALDASELSWNHRGDASSTTLRYIDPFNYNRSSMLVAQFLETLTSQIDVGAEFRYQYGKGVPGGRVSAVSVGGRFTLGDTVLSGMFGSNGIHVCYYRQLEAPLQIGLEVASNMWSETIVTGCYQMDFPKSNIIFRGLIDSKNNVCAVLEKRFENYPIMMMFSTLANRRQGEYSFGCSIAFT